MYAIKRRLFGFLMTTLFLGLFLWFICVMINHVIEATH